MTGRGFTLVELLVTISIIALLLGAIALGLNAWDQAVRQSLTINALRVGVASARAESQRGWTGTPPHRFEGAALIVEDDRFVLAMSDRNSDQFLSRIDNSLPQFRFEREPLAKTADVLIYGLWRDELSPDAQLIAPPFAVWFDPSGQLRIGEIDFEGVVMRAVIGAVMLDRDGADLTDFPIAQQVIAANPTAEAILFSRYSGDLLRQSNHP